MKPNDILMKKWCFGIGRARKMVRENNQGEAETFVQYPKYRTIALKVISAKKGSSNKLKQSNIHLSQESLKR